MPTRKDEDGRWHAEACVGRRRLHRRLPPSASAGDAKLVEAELVKALNSEVRQRAPSIPGNPLLTTLMADYTERHCLTLRSPDTARFHAYRIGKWIEGRRASEAQEVAEAICNDMHGVYAPATINRSLGALKTALKQGWRRKAVVADYSGLISSLPENNQRTTYLTLEQVGQLADCASENVRAAIWIALLTGCRRGEVCKIKAEDIGPDSIKLPAGNTKTLRYREVPIVAALRPWLKYLPLAINFEGVKSGFARARCKAGMPGVNFHDLRHSCATIILQSGGDLLSISKILGHTSIKTTQRYSHVEVSAQRAAMDKAFG